MTKSKWLLIGLALGTILFASCAGINFEYNSPVYLNQQLSELPPELLNSNIVLNEEGQSLLNPSFTIGEFLVYLMASQPLEQHSWITANVVPKEEGSVITLKQYTRGNLVLVNTINFTYQNGYAESRADMITWDDRRFEEKLEMVTLEDKAGYALLIATFIAIQ